MPQLLMAQRFFSRQFLDQAVSHPAGAFALLCLAAFLEVFADSYFHASLHRISGVGRMGSIAAGVVLLAAYGLLINVPRWDFGRMIGIYVALFFVVAQLVARLRFHEPLSQPMLVGGGLIVAGGLIIAFWKV